VNEEKRKKIQIKVEAAAAKTPSSAGLGRKMINCAAQVFSTRRELEKEVETEEGKALCRKMINCAGQVFSARKGDSEKEVETEEGK
jgi:hypothetical protein